MRTQEHFKWKLMLETSSSQYKRLCLIDKSSQLTTTAYMHSTQKKKKYIYIYELIAFHLGTLIKICTGVCLKMTLIA